MPWSYPSNIPQVVKNKPVEAQKACILAANSALEKGATEESAIFACIAASKTSKADVKKAIESKVIIPEKPKPKEKIDKAFFGPNALDPETKRNLVNADFDNQDRLVLKFDTGETITTKAIEKNIDVEQYVSVAPTKIIENGGSTPPQDIAVRIVNTDTTVTELDDIIIVTDTATITLPDAETYEKTIRIKRSGPGDVTVQPINMQLIDGLTNIVINVNYFSVDLHSDGTNWVVL